MNITAISCQPVSSAPLTFHPGECFTFSPAAAPWWDLSHITAANLGWLILAWLLAAIVLGAVQDWFTSQYEITRRGFRLSAARRWYGTRAWVILRAEADQDEPDRYQVLAWDQEDTSAPWVRVVNIDDEDADPFWTPVTNLAPEAVRKLRPWIFCYRRLPLPVLFAYKTLPRPAGDLGTDA